VFDEVFKAEGVEILRTPWRAPKANAYAEWFIRTARAECLDRIMILGARHLDLRRPLQPRAAASRSRPPNGWPPTPIEPSSTIARRDRLGGLLHEYYRKAA
jgi:hypothetical protein